MSGMLYLVLENVPVACLCQYIAVGVTTSRLGNTSPNGVPAFLPSARLRVTARFAQT
jgi:hypothetical protein